MDNIKIIYKIFSVLEKSMDFEEFDDRSISAETLGITKTRLHFILRMLLQEDLIEGIGIDVDCAGNFLISQGRPRITLKGLEYMENNSSMQRAMRMAKGIKESIPGIQ